MSQIVRSLLDLLQRRSYYSGDLLFSTEILRNVTDTFKRATYIPAPDDVQVSAFAEPPFEAAFKSQSVPNTAVTDTLSHTDSVAKPANLFNVEARLSAAQGVHNNELQLHSCYGLKGIFSSIFFPLFTACKRAKYSCLTAIILCFTLCLCTGDYSSRLDS